MEKASPSLNRRSTVFLFFTRSVLCNVNCLMVSLFYQNKRKAPYPETIKNDKRRTGT